MMTTLLRKSCSPDSSYVLCFSQFLYLLPILVFISGSCVCFRLLCLLSVLVFVAGSSVCFLLLCLFLALVFVTGSCVLFPILVFVVGSCICDRFLFLLPVLEVLFSFLLDAVCGVWNFIISVPDHGQFMFFLS